MTLRDTPPGTPPATLRGALHLPVNTLALRRGGLVKAVMLRANAVAGELDREVVIEVLAAQPRLEEDVAALVRDGFLDPRVHVRSVLSALDPALASGPGAPGGPGGPGGDPVLGCVHHAPAARVTDAGGPAIDPAEDPRAVALAAPPGPGRLTREERGSGDRLFRVQHLRSGDRAPALHRWIGRDGLCYLGIWVDPDSGSWGPSTVLLDGRLRTVSGMTELYRVAFGRLLADEHRPVLFSEFREALPNLPEGFDTVALSVEHPSATRVAVLHSNHALQGQRTLPKRSSPKFTALLTGIDRWDGVVVATAQQRDDIVAQYGGADRVWAIPHYGPAGAEPATADHDPHRFVLVARIHKKKRVDEAIEAFRLVVDRNPEARLEIYGFGYGDALEREIEAQVKRLGLAGAVRFPGFVSDVSAIYSGACASVQTSESEGFGMALLESLAHGVPVVAYDVDYGAREVVRDGVDGFVVPWGRREELADRLVELSRDRDLRNRLAAAGPARAAEFSRERYAAGWAELLAKLPDRPDARVVDGALELEVGAAEAADATLVVRPRAGGEDVEVPFVDGRARAPLADAANGTVLDVYYRRGGELRRTPCRPGGPSDDSRWQVFVTEFGNLSLRRAAPTGKPVLPGGPGFEEARRAWGRLRKGLARVRPSR